VTVLATKQSSAGGAIHLAVDAQYLYWASTDQGTVMKCTKGGCGMSPTSLASGLTSMNTDIGIAVDPSFVYWTLGGYGDFSVVDTVTRVPIGGGARQVLSTTMGAGTQMMGEIAYGGIVVDATSTYWSGASLTAGGIWKCSTGGCGTNASLVLQSAMGGIGAVAADAANVYWVETANLLYDVVACPKTGCGSSPTVLATGQTSTLAIVTDGANVYWVNGTVPGAILKCGVGGCGQAPTTLVSTPSWTVHAVAVDSGSAYYDGPGGTIAKVAK
jgi:hypothetical protein